MIFWCQKPVRGLILGPGFRPLRARGRRIKSDFTLSFYFTLLHYCIILFTIIILFTMIILFTIILLLTNI